MLSLPGVSRKTSHGLPRYRDLADAREPADVFILSGAEDLVPVATPAAGRVRYRPRTEGLFARIEHVTDGGNYWEVRTRDGLTTLYGTPGTPTGHDPAVVADPGDPGRIFAWRITQTRDLLGNVVRYDYLADSGECSARTGGTIRCCPRISYADYGDRGRAVVPGHGGVRVRGPAGPVLRPSGRVRGAHDAAVPGDPGAHPRRGRGDAAWPGSTGSPTRRRRSTGSAC